ncbi:MAG: ComF family protein [Hyphomicrobiaceae bacterium]|nr:ComF family protein [Hyphomicrobiaceae bacterium]
MPNLEGSDFRRDSSRVSAVHAGIRAAIGWLADVMMPPLCLACHTPLASKNAICADCWRNIDFIRPPLCDRLGIPLPYDAGSGAISAEAAASPPVYARARAVARYDGVMRDLIHDMKFHDRHDARALFGRWMCEAGAGLIADADILVPIPLHRMKLLRRRFNQSSFLAIEIAAITGLPVAHLALVRSRATQSQIGLTREQRRLNVRGAFEVPTRHRALIAGRRALIVDDVITTGATVTAASRALLDAGATAVDVLALGLVTDATATLLA